MALTTEKKPLDSLYKAVSSQIKINGQLLDSDFEVNKIITFKEINKLSRARIQILGGDYTKNTFNESENKIFDPGNEVEIKFGYDQKLTLIFEGIILKSKGHILLDKKKCINFANKNKMFLIAK